MAGRAHPRDPLTIPVGRRARATITRRATGIRITLAGELDLANADAARQVVLEALRIGPRPPGAILDLAAVECVEGAARGALDSCGRYCAEHGIALRVVAPRSRRARVSLELGSVFQPDEPASPAGLGT